MSITFRTEKDVARLPVPPRPEPGKKAKAVHYLHEGEPGFGVRIMPPTLRGDVRRVWFVRLGQRREKIGEYPAMPLSEARTLALGMRAQYAKDRAGGVDRDATFEDAWEAYRQAKGGDWSEDTRNNYDVIIRKHLKVPFRARGVDQPALWTMPLRKITEQYLDDFIGAVTDRARETNRSRGLMGSGRVMAARVGALVHAVLHRAVRRGQLSKNPMAVLVDDGLLKPPPRRHRAIHQDVLPMFWRWLHTEAHPAARDYVLINLFLGLRRSVLGSLRWSQLDTTNWTLAVPPFVRGNKPKQPFAHPLPDYLVEHVFKPRLEAGTKHPEWIIESNRLKGRPYRSIRGILSSFEKRSGIRVTAHDLRRTSATLIYAATHDRLLAARLLTHNMQNAADFDATTAGYLVHSTEELRRAMNKTVEFVLKLVEGSTGATGEYDEAAAEVEAIHAPEDPEARLFLRPERLKGVRLEWPEEPAD